MEAFLNKTYGQGNSARSQGKKFNICRECTTL